MSDALDNKIESELKEQIQAELDKKGIQGKVVIDKVVAKGTILAARTLALELAQKIGMEAAVKEATKTTAKTITRKVTRRSVEKFLAKGIGKTAAKQGGKVATKLGGRLLPGINIVLFAMDFVPEAIEEQTKATKRQWKEAKKAREEWKAGDRKAAAKRFARSGLRGMVEAPVVFGKAAVAGFTAKEVSDLIPDLPDHFLATDRAKKNPSGTPYLLALMLALRTAYQYAHWNTPNYSDHLLFERLYLSLDADIDKLAELSMYANAQVRPLKVEIDQLESAERSILGMIETIMAQEKVSRGMENFLMTLYENREQALYLLGMRGHSKSRF